MVVFLIVHIPTVISSTERIHCRRSARFSSSGRDVQLVCVRFFPLATWRSTGARFAELGEVDLLIRSGGEKRLSNFLLLPLAYSELYFTDTLWPDFNEESFDEALAAFAQRKRNFGVRNYQPAPPAAKANGRNGRVL